ncbi:hypothetical protein EV356DRAFT_537346 [Viridothelium virens]|uniref:Uncharacterized protein n=1 Tax=Viridothelium virens TaxID=1048519 RepID=A0A6A6GUS7_VIRVR|nr:hypothetical protein EV356DRAFT_537346 [Viridothelium virens]
MSQNIFFIYGLPSVNTAPIITRVLEIFQENGAAVETTTPNPRRPECIMTVIFHGPRYFDLVKDGEQDDYWQTRLVTTIHTESSSTVAHDFEGTIRMYNLFVYTLIPTGARKRFFPIILHSGEDLEGLREARRIGGSFDALEMVERYGFTLNVIGITLEEMAWIIYEEVLATHDGGSDGESQTEL